MLPVDDISQFETARIIVKQFTLYVSSTIHVALSLSQISWRNFNGVNLNAINGDLVENVAIFVVGDCTKCGYSVVTFER